MEKKTIQNSNDFLNSFDIKNYSKELVEFPFEEGEYIWVKTFNRFGIQDPYETLGIFIGVFPSPMISPTNEVSFIYLLTYYLVDELGNATSTVRGANPLNCSKASDG